MSTALVTGASRGIGAAIAKELAAQGIEVLLNYKSNESAAVKVKEEIENLGGKATLLRFDVSNAQEVQVAIDKWKQENSEKLITILVNNAGIRADGLFAWMEENQWNDVINTNLNAFYFVTKSLINDMIMSKFGRIVNVVSLSGIKGQPGQTNYAAAKAGVIAATKSLAQELGRMGITANCIAPGFIETDMTEEIDQKEMNKLIPIRRFGKPEEVAALVNFLVSKNAAYITGETISINGGLYT